MILWGQITGRFHDYYWYTEILPNGWSASVSDQSQASAPQRPTSYTASAVCRAGIISDGRAFETLEGAKSIALSLSLAQPVVPDDPKCLPEAQAIFRQAWDAHNGQQA